MAKFLQEESLKGKAKTIAYIEELERLVPLLKEALAAEVSQKLSAAKEEIEAAATAGAAAKAAEEVFKTQLMASFHARDTHQRLLFHCKSRCISYII